MPDPTTSFPQKYKQALITAGLLIALFVVIYYLLPPELVSFLYK